MEFIRKPTLIKETINDHMDFCLSAALIIAGIILILIGFFGENRKTKIFTLMYVALPI